jgi:hypothetical protein
MEEAKATPKPGTWFFGDDWPGQRCGAKTRRGTPCLKAALRGKRRCQLHGGRAGAPSGERNGNYRTGAFTKETQQRARDELTELRGLFEMGQELGLFPKTRRHKRKSSQA